MNPVDSKHVVLASATLAVVAALALWSWNTLATLFGLPAAGPRHAAAALLLLAMLRGWLLPGPDRRHRRRWHAPRSR